jgi:hypothetical protein
LEFCRSAKSADFSGFSAYWGREGRSASAMLHAATVRGGRRAAARNTLPGESKMADYLKLAKDLILSDSKIDEAEVKLLKKYLYADGKIDADEVKFLVDLRKSAKKKTITLSTEFDKLFLKAVGDHAAGGGKVSPETVSMLKKEVVGGGFPGDQVKKLFGDVKKKLTKSSAEFDKLHASVTAAK